MNQDDNGKNVVSKVSDLTSCSDFSTSSPVPCLNPLSHENNRIDLIRDLLASLSKEGVVAVYNHVRSLLFTDFTEVFPEEVSLRVFSYLDQLDLCKCKLMSKRWKRLLEDPGIWKALYMQKGWFVNENVLNEFEAWRRTHKFPQPRFEIFLKQQNIIGPYGTMFLPQQFIFDSNGRPLLNWSYLYKEHAHLDSNWRHGRFLVSTFNNPSIRFPADQDFRATLDSVYCVQYDDEIMVSGSKDRTVSVWDVNSRFILYKLYGHSGSVLCLDFCRRRNLLVSGSSDSTIIIWDWQNRRPLKVYFGHTDNVLGVVVSENYIISSSRDHTARVWRLDATSPAEACMHVLRGHLASVNSVQYSSKTGLIVTASSDRTLRTWDITTGHCIRIIHAHQRGIACAQYNGKFIVSGSSDLTIRIFEASSGKLLRMLQGHEDLIRTVRFNDEKIVSGGYDGTVRIWNFNTGEQHCVLHNSRNSRVFGLQFDHRRIIACTHSSEILVWNFDDGLDCTFF
ncbi:F-box/WD repeat-containing protein pof11 [Schizosaccharomyces pombe]